MTSVLSQDSSICQGVRQRNMTSLTLAKPFSKSSERPGNEWQTADILVLIHTLFCINTYRLPCNCLSYLPSEIPNTPKTEKESHGFSLLSPFHTQSIQQRVKTALWGAGYTHLRVLQHQRHFVFSFLIMSFWSKHNLMNGISTKSM